MDIYGDDYSEIKWNENDKKILDEIIRHIQNNNLGEALKCINHEINSYLNKALLQVQGLMMEEYKTPEKQKEALEKIYQNSLKASVISKKLKNFYNL